MNDGEGRGEEGRGGVRWDGISSGQYSCQDPTDAHSTKHQH